MAPITASTPVASVREPSLPVKLLPAGSAACVADLFTFPLDTAKVRLQVLAHRQAPLFIALFTSSTARRIRLEVIQSPLKLVLGFFFVNNFLGFSFFTHKRRDVDFEPWNLAWDQVLC